MTRPDPEIHAVLGVAPDADDATVKKAYRTLAMKLHPDRNPGDAAARARWDDVNRAYAAWNASHAKPSDEAGAPAGAAGGVPFDPTVFDDIFRDFFGGQPGTVGAQKPRKGADRSMPLRVSEGDALHGVVRMVALDRRVLCVPCSGTGAVGGELRACSTCEGRGQTKQTKGLFTLSAACTTCSGRGRIAVKPCDACTDGLCARSETIRVTVPSGVEVGQVLRIGGKGDESLGGVPGDLYLTLEIEPSGTLARKNADAVVEVVVSARHVLLGGAITVPTLDGETTIRVPRGVRDGMSLTLAGRGHAGAIDPSRDPYRGEAARGDHLVVFRVPPDVAALPARIAITVGVLAAVAALLALMRIAS